ncbi:hypothetical protein QQ045_029370 [Rhodiola kirilowii]
MKFHEQMQGPTITNVTNHPHCIIRERKLSGFCGGSKGGAAVQVLGGGKSFSGINSGPRTVFSSSSRCSVASVRDSVVLAGSGASDEIWAICGLGWAVWGGVRRWRSLILG